MIEGLGDPVFDALMTRDGNILVYKYQVNEPEDQWPKFQLDPETLYLIIEEMLAGEMIVVKQRLNGIAVIGLPT